MKKSETPKKGKPTPKKLPAIFSKSVPGRRINVRRAVYNLWK